MFPRARRWRVNRKRQIDESTILKIRIGVLHGMVALTFLVLSAQLWRLQVVEGKSYQEQAEANRLRVISVASQRGVMYDRNGEVLAQNVPSFSLTVTAGDLPEDQETAIARRLSSILDVPSQEIAEWLHKRRSLGRAFRGIPVATIDQEQALLVKEHLRDLPGVSVMAEAKRHYPQGPLLAHLLGYVAKISAEEYTDLEDKGYEAQDWIGKVGLERWYEDTLRGAPGWAQVEVNANGERLRTLASEEPQDGLNLVLSIDLELQQEMTRLLQESMGDSNYAVAIAMVPKTGEVLGLVSLPSYDNNLFTASGSEEAIARLLEDPRRPLLNYATGGMHPPGSIFKIITASAALQEGVASPSTRIVSTGRITVPNQYDPSIIYTFYDWAALGSLDFYRALAMSSDVYFYYLSGGYQDFAGLGAKRLASYAREFSLGQPTGIELPGEIPGLVPDPSWKELALNEPWLLGDTYNFGIGQGYALVTPMQMLMMVSAVANWGVIQRPQLAREIVDSDGNVVRPFTPETARQVPVAPGLLRIVRDGMRQAVTSGTATRAKIPGVDVAGKTGTAEFGAPTPDPDDRPTHGWFVGFAPALDPEIAVVVFVERGNGAKSAAPVAGGIMEYYLKRGS